MVDINYIQARESVLSHIVTFPEDLILLEPNASEESMAHVQGLIH